MSCTNCGAETPDGAEQCPSCGAPLLASRPAAGAAWGAPAGRPGEDQPAGAPPFGAPSGPPQYSAPPFGVPGGAPGGGQQFGAPAGGQQYGGQQFGAPAGGQQYGGQQFGAPAGGQPYGAYPSSGFANQPVTTSGQLAGWWQRVGATLIDGIILFVVSAVVGVVAGRGVEYLVGFIVGLAYTAGLLVKQGQTVGMMAVGTRCVQEASGSNLTIGPAIGRYVLAEILGITVIGGILDILWPLWDAKNQTLHDKAVGSLVVRTR